MQTRTLTKLIWMEQHTDVRMLPNPSEHLKSLKCILISYAGRWLVISAPSSRTCPATLRSMSAVSAITWTSAILYTDSSCVAAVRAKYVIPSAPAIWLDAHDAAQSIKCPHSLNLIIREMSRSNPNHQRQYLRKRRKCHPRSRKNKKREN